MLHPSLRLAPVRVVCIVIFAALAVMIVIIIFVVGSRSDRSETSKASSTPMSAMPVSPCASGRYVAFLLERVSVAELAERLRSSSFHLVSIHDRSVLLAQSSGGAKPDSIGQLYAMGLFSSVADDCELTTW